MLEDIPAINPPRVEATARIIALVKVHDPTRKEARLMAGLKKA